MVWDFQLPIYLCQQFSFIIYDTINDNEISNSCAFSASCELDMNYAHKLFSIFIFSFNWKYHWIEYIQLNLTLDNISNGVYSTENIYADHFKQEQN